MVFVVGEKTNNKNFLNTKQEFKDENKECENPDRWERRRPAGTLSL